MRRNARPLRDIPDALMARAFSVLESDGQSGRNLRPSPSSRYSSLANGRECEIFPTAEGAIHPETLRQKDRLCNELWRAALIFKRPPTGQRDGFLNPAR